MLRDVDNSLAGWLVGYLPAGTEIVFDAPGSREPARPMLGLYLHEVREEGEVTPSDWSDVRGDDGVLIGRLPPQRRYRLTYLATAWAGHPLDEHEMLGRILAGCAAHNTIPAQFLSGSLVDLGQAVMVRCAPFDRSCDPRELWAAWRTPPRTALEISVLSPMPVSLFTDLPLPARSVSLTSSRPPNGAPGFENRNAWPPPRGRIGISE